MPPPSYGVPDIRAANSADRSPANTRWAWESTNPGTTARPARSRRSSASGARDAGPVHSDPAVVDHDRGVAQQPEPGVLGALERVVEGDQLGDPGDQRGGHASSHSGSMASCEQRADVAQPVLAVR